jgi:hypothetical protein
MAKATTATKSTSTVQPTPKATKTTGKTMPPPQANGHGQPATPPAKETRIINGVIERYAHGRLISREEPKPAATPKLAPKPTPAKTPPQATEVPTGPTPGEAYFVGKLGTEDLWHFAPVSAASDSHVMVCHYKGYDLLSEYRRSAEYAQKLYRDLLERGFVFIDGVQHKLVDEDA